MVRVFAGENSLFGRCRKRKLRQSTSLRFSSKTDESEIVVATAPVHFCDLPQLCTVPCTTTFMCAFKMDVKLKRYCWKKRDCSSLVLDKSLLHIYEDMRKIVPNGAYCVIANWHSSRSTKGPQWIYDAYARGQEADISPDNTSTFNLVCDQDIDTRLGDTTMSSWLFRVRELIPWLLQVLTQSKFFIFSFL